ncbi:MAG TPA: carboxypeptidase regulatory-like domain-containing protein [Bacteroidia bacterium]|jgi:hypothetical protein|nr:carboxypeptidase regulatory-like domain-containing protein [Bacteroidia bacterium]
MKKTLLIAAFFTANLLNAQDHWDTVLTKGGGINKTHFNLIKVFKNKLYIAGADSLGVNLNAYSSSTGAHGTFIPEAGLPGVLQGLNENGLTAITANANFMFYGSGVKNDGINNKLPAVYRFDGTTYSSFGSIPYDVTGPNRVLVTHAPLISALALYSPTGANDSIYAFVNPDSTTLSASVWKSPTGTPNWVNAGRFSSASGITSVNDAIVWHKRLYIAVNGRDSTDINMTVYKVSHILSTANGIKWDTVATTNALLSTVGGTLSAGMNFYQLEIHKDTLYTVLSGMSDNHILWYTGDSLTNKPIWHSVGPISQATSCWVGVMDLQSAWGRLWLTGSITPCLTGGGSSNLKSAAIPNSSQSLNYGNPSVYVLNKGVLLQSSGGTDIENGSNYSVYSLAFFNNALFTSGSRLYRDVNYQYGNAWRLVPPHAAFIDSTSTGTNFCTNNATYLNSNSSTNTHSVLWKINGNVYSHTADTIWVPSAAGTYSVTEIAYNGTFASNMVDSTKSTITIFQTPIIDSLRAKLNMVCQGQTDTLTMYFHGGTGPFTFSYLNTLNNDHFNNVGNPGLVKANTAPTSYFKGIIKDANGCINTNGFITLTVNIGDSLSGSVADTLLAPVNSGKVYLFKLNPLKPKIGDTTGLISLNATGKYYFPAVFYGNYVVKAIADTSNPLYKTAVGTYYSNKTFPFQWDSAKVIQHYTCTGANKSGNDIKILQMPGISSGPCTIDGIITKDSTYGARYAGDFAPLGAPLKGVDVKLGKNPGGSPAARTTTDGSGHYSFHNVPLGNYKIYVDIPNYGMDSVRAVTLSSGNPNSVNNNYYVDSNMVRVIPVGNVSASICQGDSIKLQGSYQKTAGIYRDTINVHGHDSLVFTTLSVKPLPTLTVSASADTICNGNSAVLTAIGNSASYLWSANAGSVTTATVSVSPTTTTTYTITGTLNACPVVKTIKVAVKSCIGIQTINQNGFTIYPNPASDKLFVQSSKAGSMKLVDIMGRVVLEQALITGNNEINVSGLPVGPYAISIQSNGQITTGKLMINK